MSGFDLTLWVITPISGAVIGYFTNWLAIKMLFRPLTEKRIWGIKVPLTPGLIPKERFRISKKIAETISTHLLTEEALAAALSSDRTVAGINEIINSVFNQLENDTNTFEHYLKLLLKERYSEDLAALYVKQALAKVLPGLVENLTVQIKGNEYLNDIARVLVAKLVEDKAGKLLGMFLNPDKIYESIKKSIIEYLSEPDNHDKIYLKICELIDTAPNSALKEAVLSVKVNDAVSKLITPNKQKIIETAQTAVKPLVTKAASYAANSLDIEQLIVDKMNTFEVAEAEKIIISVVDKELKAITIVGGILGFIIGLLPAILRIFQGM